MMPSLEEATLVAPGPVIISADRSTAWTDRLNRLAPWALAGALFLFVLRHLNIWPGTLPESAAFVLFGGNAHCLAGEFPNIDFACDANGYPSGLIVAFGYPQVWMTAAVEWATPLNTLNSFRFVWAVMLLIAFSGARRLFSLVTDSAWLPWIGAALFLLSPIVANQGGYGPLQLGFALLPTYVLVDRWFILCVERGQLRLLAGSVAVLLRVFALFTDGYSFVMSLIPIGVMYAVWGVRSLRRSTWRPVVVALANAAFSVAVAYLAYTRYLGVSAFVETSEDFFRGQGVDLFALAVPPPSNWIIGSIGLHHSVEATQAYSDGRNLSDVYLGWALLAAALGGVVVAYRRRFRGVLMIAVVTAGVVGFLFALGPSLKIADFRPSLDLVNGVPSSDVYSMPRAEATMPTGLAPLYGIPGIDTMRALYRWELLVRLSLLLLAVVGVSRLVARGGARRAAGVLVLVLVTAETLSSPAVAHRRGEAALSTVDRFTTSVVDPLRDHLAGGERVVLVNPAPGGSGTNFYLANWMCPSLAIRCFNVGGDKGGALAADDQPLEVQQVLFSTDDLQDRIDTLFAKDLVDAVVLVEFDMRANAYFWPPTSENEFAAEQAAAPIIESGRFDSVTLDWTTVLRPLSGEGAR